MPGRSPHVPGHLALLLLSGALAGCGGGTTSDSSSVVDKSPPAAVQVTIAPTSASVVTGSGHVTFSAAVKNASDTGVSWQVGGVPGGNQSMGTISASGDYLAPATVPVPSTVTVTAVSDADPTKTASAAVSISAPPVSLPSVPGGLAASNITTGSLTLSWSASTEAGGSIGGYYVYCNAVLIATVTGATSYVDATLNASTLYSYQVAAFDQAATPHVSAPSAALSVMTLADTAAPTVPAGLAATAVATGSVTLGWSASTDLPTPGATGVGGYYLYRNGVRIGPINNATSYTDTPLTAATTYSYQVAAFDKATPPNLSALSGVVSVTTLPDTQAPTVPTGLSASGIGPCCATLHWNASTDLPNPGATGVGGYYVYRNAINVATVTSGTSYVDSTLSPATSYSYQVAAFDKAATPNISALSAVLAVTTGDTLALTPRNAALTLAQTQQFSVSNAPAGTTLTWAVDGVAGGNSTVGTISSGGLYTAPASAGTHSVTATGSTQPALTGSAALAVTDLSGVTTWHNDLARTGQNLHEYALTPATVSGGNFGKRWSCPLDGTVYAQPLYVAHLAIGGGVHNVLYVVTMHDTVYAFDADSSTCATFWTLSLINPSAGVTTQANVAGCADTPGEYGITGTPVIDPNSQTLYLVAATTENGSNVQRLHALNLVTGTEATNSPVAIAAQLPGTGDGNTVVVFNPLYQNQRPGLVLTSDGGVVIGWASHCDVPAAPYHGWMMRYDAASLAQIAVFNDTPNGNAGGIWMSGGAPAVDSGGNMFLSTGNGTFDDTTGSLAPMAPNNDFGESFVRLNQATLVLQDFYTPSNYQNWSGADLDISAGGITVLPDGTGPAGHTNVMVGTDKQGHLWMIDRSSMSGYLPGMDNTVQFLTLPYAYEYAIHSCLAYWNATIYVSVGKGPLLALQLNANGLVPFSGSVAIAASQSVETYNFPNPTPAISASPNGGAIAWVLDNNANGTDTGSTALGPAILRAYDATNLATTLYSSATLAADAGGNAAKFAVPVVANGHVYVAGTGVLTVYGLAP
jgi:hypothetical protein